MSENKGIDDFESMTRKEIEDELLQLRVLNPSRMVVVQFEGFEPYDPMPLVAASMLVYLVEITKATPFTITGADEGDLIAKLERVHEDIELHEQNNYFVGMAAAAAMFENVQPLILGEQ